MFAVCVTFQLNPGSADAFLPLMRQNASTSLQAEKGCHQFDVLTDVNKPNAVFLYELYTDKAAFDVHLASAHFQTFDAAATPMIATKDVQTWDTVAQ